MTDDVKRLLAEATPLPWSYDREGFGYIHSLALGALDGDSGATVHWDYEGLGAIWNHDADPDLIVYAVNRLPDYETAIDVLERLVATWDAGAEDTIGENVLALAPLIREGGAILRRLREPVPA